ncbi:MAG: hypothetical protein NW241_17100 [Bacteroidia bacterium]|nr:hypothetical protein [Bacteroidia bacterium]
MLIWTTLLLLHAGCGSRQALPAQAVTDPVLETGRLFPGGKAVLHAGFLEELAGYITCRYLGQTAGLPLCGQTLSEAGYAFVSASLQENQQILELRVRLHARDAAPAVTHYLPVHAVQGGRLLYLNPFAADLKALLQAVQSYPNSSLPDEGCVLCRCTHTCAGAEPGCGSAAAACADAPCITGCSSGCNHAFTCPPGS